MGLFDSDNIWKRQARQQREAMNPPSEHEKWEKELRSNILWLIGGIVVVVMFLAAIAAGAMTMNLTSAVIVFMIAAYCVMTAGQIGKLKKNEPKQTRSHRKK